MEGNLSQEHTASETKGASAVATSVGKRSPKKEKTTIDRSMRLRILQQALFDYQEAGGEILTPDVGIVGTAFVLVAVNMDDVGNLTLKSANTIVGNVGTKETV